MCVHHQPIYCLGHWIRLVVKLPDLNNLQGQTGSLRYLEQIQVTINALQLDNLSPRWIIGYTRDVAPYVLLLTRLSLQE